MKIGHDSRRAKCNYGEPSELQICRQIFAANPEVEKTAAAPAKCVAWHCLCGGREINTGGNYVAVPLVRLASEVGFRVTVVDGCPAYAVAERFPEADAVIAAGPESLVRRLAPGERTNAVIMSHNYLVDQAWLKCLLPLNLRYIGLAGPRKREDKMLAEICGAEFNPSPDQLSSLRNPLGLDIGAENPEQIALAVLAEIQAEENSRIGDPVRTSRDAHRVRLPVEFSPPQKFVKEATPCPVSES